MMSVDKTKWQRGPWDTETDNDAWDLPNGLHALIRRGPVGALCGYVGVPPGHPWHGRGYDVKLNPTKQMLEGKLDINEVCIISLFCATIRDQNPEEGIQLNLAVRVHGGLTFANKISQESLGHEDYWYFGFDCAHAGDLIPGMTQYHFHTTYEGEIYRTEEFVRGEIAHLSEEMLNIPPPCVELEITWLVKKPHRSLRPKKSNHTALRKPISIAPLIWTTPLARQASSRKRKTYRKLSRVPTVVTI